MNMPKLVPIPIDTKDQNIFIRIWRWITSIRNWEVAEDWEYTLPDNTNVVIPKGFIFDGASIPRILWSLLSPSGLLLIPGLIYDFGYRYDYLWTYDENGNPVKYKINNGRKNWDKIFRLVGLQVNGMAIIDAIAYAMLWLFGFFAWRSNRKRNVDEVFPKMKEIVKVQEPVRKESTEKGHLTEV